MAARRVHMQLKVEELEPRIAPAGLEPVVQAAYEVGSSLVSPTWFQGQAASSGDSGQGSLSVEQEVTEIDWKGQMLTAYSSEWIVQLSNDALDRITSVGEATNVFEGSEVDFDVMGGLGMAGQILVNSADAAMSDVVEWMSSSADIAYFEPNVVSTFDVTPNDPSFSWLWALNNTGQTGGTADADMDAPEAWNISTGSQSIVVAVIDTGVDYTHPDLAANIWTNPGEIAGNGIDDDGNGFVDDVHGYDFVNNDGNPMDDNRHGTHVAGTIGAVGNNALGVAGVNWTTSIMALKFLSASGSGSTADAVRAINYATMMKTQYGVNVRVESNSWGGGGYSQSLRDAISATGNAGILFVAAAGNSASNNDSSPMYPASYDLPNIIAVAATDNKDALASFSSYGATSVDLAAPGVSIYSTVPGGGYASLSGTSMATPQVSGVAALALSVNFNASVQQLRDAILGGVDPVSSLNGKVATGGRVNALNTLNRMNNSMPVVTISATDPSAAEQGLDTGTFTIARTGSAAASLTVRYSLAGTATNGSDYSTLSGTVAIGAGQSSTTVVVRPIDDTASEGSETVALTLVSGSAYSVGSPGSATVTIADNDQSALPVVTLTAADPSAAEQGRNTGAFAVTRTGSVASSLTVYYTIGGTATNGTDYSRIGGSVTLSAGRSSAIVTVTPVDDTLYEGPETVVLNLSSNSRYTVGSSGPATVTIADNDMPLLPTVNIAASDPNAAEQGRDRGVFTITRTGNMSSRVVVNYSIGGTAANGVDYTRISGAATIGAGLSSTTVTITPIDDTLVEPTETVVLTLAGSSSYVVGSSPTAIVSIVDNDKPLVYRTYSSANAPLPILDFRTTTSTLTISDSFTIADLDVKLNMAHTYDGDLTVTLRGPSGATVTLFRNVGGSGDNFTNTVLDDEAAGSITSGNAPFSGSLKPQTALSAFDGKNARGTWTLSVTDSYRYDTGTLKGWSLIVGAPSASVKGLMDEELGDAVAAFTAPTQATRPVSRPDMGLLVRLYAGCLGSGGSSGSEPCNATPRRAATLEAAVGTIEVRSDLVPQPSSMPDVQRMFRAVSGHRASPSDPQGVANADGMDSGPAIVPAGMEGAPAMSELEGVRIVQRIK